MSRSYSSQFHRRGNRGQHWIPCSGSHNWWVQGQISTWGLGSKFDTGSTAPRSCDVGTQGVWGYDRISTRSVQKSVAEKAGDQDTWRAASALAQKSCVPKGRPPQQVGPLLSLLTNERFRAAQSFSTVCRVLESWQAHEIQLPTLPSEKCTNTNSLTISGHSWIPRRLHGFWLVDF